MDKLKGWERKETTIKVGKEEGGDDIKEMTTQEITSAHALSGTA
jgi:hypothetical protein